MTIIPNLANRRANRTIVLLCVAVLLISVLPLYGISMYNHAYYDDYSFSVDTHRAWQETGSLSSVLNTALDSARHVRETWQGTYTGTLLSNFQPGVFSENLYWIGSIMLLTVFLFCFWIFFKVIFGELLGLQSSDTVILACLALSLMVQFMPDIGEAFFWFNGGIGNTFIYSLLALSFALVAKLARTGASECGVVRTTLLMLALALLMLLLGGGSYGGGLLGLCGFATITLLGFIKQNRRKWHFLGLWMLFFACFLYSMAAPGNTVRAGFIGAKTPVLKTIVQAMYYGVAQIGGFIRLPLIAVSLMVSPLLYQAAKKSGYAFNHPWLLLGLMICLFCVQLAPPLFSGVFIGGGRIINTYFQSFVVLWFLYLYYLIGFLARRVAKPIEISPKAMRGLILTAVCVLLVGCQGFKRPSDRLYGVQNMAGMSAALSLVTGEAKDYHRDMCVREKLLKDQSMPVITLSPLSVVPSVFMPDLLTADAEYDVRPTLCRYYGKEAIELAEEEGLV